MSGIGDQGMMPEHVRPQAPDDDTTADAESQDAPETSGDRSPEDGDGDVRRRGSA